MKRSWGWILGAIFVVWLLCRLTLETSMKPASRFAKHSVAWSGESRSPSPCQRLLVLSVLWIRSVASPQEVFFTLDVLLRAEDLDSVGPPSGLEFRGPPGTYRDRGGPVRLSVAKVATEAEIGRGKLGLRPEFSSGWPPALKIRGFATRFS